MTTQQKRDLQDLFEGSFEEATAFWMLGLSGDRDAVKTWRRWQREFDELGSYMFDGR
jgi:hypothetical protein